jgi:three-Cys-motif partner protein
VPPTTTLWPLEPHTAAKHAILRKYLNQWLPKLATWQGRVVFVDGFAGPGEYEGGEDGSPIIALKAAIKHKAQLTAEMVFFFIEADKQRFEHLVALVEQIEKPKNVVVGVEHGNFVEEYGKILDQVEEGGHNLAPSLVMVDPFGWSGS